MIHLNTLDPFRVITNEERYLLPDLSPQVFSGNFVQINRNPANQLLFLKTPWVAQSRGDRLSDVSAFRLLPGQLAQPCKCSTS